MCDCVIGIHGILKHTNEVINIINVCGPHDDAKKIKLWDKLSSMLEGKENEAWIICGDFNEVREESDRFNCEFLEYRARRFNDFIASNSLMEIPLGGRNFTRVSDDGVKFSKLDRFLVSDKCHFIWSDLTAVALERKFSDHCPIVLKDDERNFGPKPFKVFDAWFTDEGVDKLVQDAWKISVPEIQRKDCMFRNHLKNVKNALKDWSYNNLKGIDGDIEALKSVAINLELKAESMLLDDTEQALWKELRKKWLEKERLKTEMLKQKARIKWVIEGDEKQSTSTH
ncbi:uncharacterized protein [Rutidosis leptorrhynchoides]|uniref:uncharacterized protein n=1 Tax=Rutidosis leptorrhynchoides TaxID=125765 RepID=UPI003A98D021